MSKPTNIEVHLVQRFNEESRYEVTWKEGDWSRVTPFYVPGNYVYTGSVETGGIRTFLTTRLKEADYRAVAFARLLRGTENAEIRTKIDF